MQSMILGGILDKKEKILNWELENVNEFQVWL